MFNVVSLSPGEGEAWETLSEEGENPGTSTAPCYTVKAGQRLGPWSRFLGPSLEKRQMLAFVLGALGSIPNPAGSGHGGCMRDLQMTISEASLWQSRGVQLGQEHGSEAEISRICLTQQGENIESRPSHTSPRSFHPWMVTKFHTCLGLSSVIL